MCTQMKNILHLYPCKDLYASVPLCQSLHVCFLSKLFSIIKLSAVDRPIAKFDLVMCTVMCTVCVEEANQQKCRLM